MTFLAENLENTPKKVTCTRCGYTWRTRSRNRLVTCGQCSRKTLNQWGKKQKTDTKRQGKIKIKIKPKSKVKSR